ncbi:hypothetical protein [Natronoflexus pectinivorans]|uniref:Hpr(Ser) kinase/phosphatase n=1 Tax=Natronoflexus pectinivorans TaxID=682526 RepID=A0A4R2GHW9_9BACT|nr:hypothetical protein [Natronoflexus pectinivorans]TCO07433.1 hypothetical protein EV194_10838 [Natronoflexus pectinivorans]
MDLFLGPVKLTVLNKSNQLVFKLLPSSGYTKPIIQSSAHYKCHYHTTNNLPPVNSYQKKLTGESTDKEMMPYNWHILYGNGEIVINVDYLKQNEAIEELVAFVNNDKKEINIWIKPTTQEALIIDPLFQPLGSLLMVYLAYYTGGFLIHASGVTLNHHSFLFTAVSGTGKSTMAGLWKKAGADVINDDRLWLHKVNGIWHMFNTPMVFYAQTPKKSKIDGIFLLKQSKTNELHQLTGLNASMRVMANCIQHFFNQEMTQEHLDRVLDFTTNTPIYDCGFKPDGEIVEEIRGLMV